MSKETDENLATEQDLKQLDMIATMAMMGLTSGFLADGLVAPSGLTDSDKREIARASYDIAVEMMRERAKHVHQYWPNRGELTQSPEGGYEK